MGGVGRLLLPPPREVLLVGCSHPAQAVKEEGFLELGWRVGQLLVPLFPRS